MQTLNREFRTGLHGVAAVLAGCVIFWIIVSSSGVHNSLVDAVNAVLYYPELPSLELRNIIKLSSNWVLERASLQDRVSQLEVNNQSMKAELQRAGIPVPVQRASYLTARITLRYPEEWWRELRIDRGRKDGVREGSAVVSEGYLIGRVTRLGDNYSWVELITSSTFLIAAAVDETRDLGVVNGDDKGNLKLLYVPEDRRLRNGMKISTSLMSEQVPPGIAIGTIIGADSAKEGFLPMRVQAGAHITQLYNVEVYTASGAKTEWR